MFRPIFKGDDFSYFYEKETGEYMLYWRKYEINIYLKGEDARLFQQQLDIIDSEPEEDKNKKIERSIKIQFYFRYACPIPHFSNEELGIRNEE